MQVKTRCDSRRNGFRIVNTSEVMIFGGDGVQIKLNKPYHQYNLRHRNIILAVSQGGIVDFNREWFEK
jgi:hypothetical protein